MGLSEEQARANYPGCVDAVMFTENPLCAIMWDFIRSKGEAPAVVRDKLVATSTKVATLLSKEKFTIIKEQMEHPDFLKYVIAKLGYM